MKAIAAFLLVALMSSGEAAAPCPCTTFFTGGTKPFIAEGLAREEAGRTLYRRDLLTHLQAQEIAETGAAYAGAIGKRYVPAASGAIEGVYREPVQLISGKFAVIEKAREFTLVPWRPVLDRELGKSVRGTIGGDTISWTLGRSRGQSIS